MLQNKRNREIVGIIASLFSIVILLSLLTYDNSDYRQLILNNPLNNIMGPMGVLISHTLFSALGYSSYLLIIIALIIALSLFRNGTLHGSIEKIISIIIIYITILVIVFVVIWYFLIINPNIFF